jgi:hypothetical protein
VTAQAWNIQTNGEQLQIGLMRGGHLVHVIASTECTAEDLGRLLAHMEATADEHARTVGAVPFNLTRGVLRGTLSVHDADGNDITQPPTEASSG